MPSTTDESAVRGLFALFKGDSGAGKTVGALSFPTPYHFDFDNKMPAIAIKHFRGKKIDYDAYDNTFEVRDKINEFKNYCPYETLVFDSLTALNNIESKTIGMLKNEATMDHFERMRVAASRLASNKTNNIETKTIDYYNGAARFFQEYFFDELKKLWIQPGKPHHIIVIAHVMTKTSNPDLKTKVVTETRSIVTAGKAISAYVPTVFDEDYLFATESDDAFAGTIKRVCCTESIGEDSAKTAYNFPKTIDFTDGSLYEELKGYADFPKEEE